MGFIVCQPDCRTTFLLFKDSTASNHNVSLCRFSLCYSGNELLAGEALVRHDNVGTEGVVGGGDEVEGTKVKRLSPKSMIFAQSKKQVLARR